MVQRLKERSFVARTFSVGNGAGNVCSDSAENRKEGDEEKGWTGRNCRLECLILA